MLKITGKQIPRETLTSFKNINLDENKEDVVEFITPGTISSMGDTTYISYEETAISGMEGCKTSLTIAPGKVTMTRKGEALEETIMEFEKGKRYTGLYSTPYGSIVMELLTNDVKGSIGGEKENKLSIDYDISLKGLAESRNMLDIEIIRNGKQ
ncbi:MAG: DUF1934 domain-containing protein [Clostridia bacterium]|nr:DUF1934 domain-containing protein [Clostridia bacterium]